MIKRERTHTRSADRTNPQPLYRFDNYSNEVVIVPSAHTSDPVPPPFSFPPLPPSFQTRSYSPCSSSRPRRLPLSPAVVMSEPQGQGHGAAPDGAAGVAANAAAHGQQGKIQQQQRW